MASRLQKAIGAVKDQTSINLAKINNTTSSNLKVAIIKATSHDDSPVDDRYVYQILQLVSSNKTYAAACARTIGKRITRTRNWVVALKSLTLVLRIFQDGDPYFPRELLHATKRGSRLLNLADFRRDSNSNLDYTAFVRMLGLYLDERLGCFLTGKLQRRYMHKEREGSRRYRERTNEYVRDMKPSMLIDRIVHWQRLLGRAVAARPTGRAKDHRLVKVALYAVVRESFDLYRDISDGLALLLDSFYHLQYEACVGVFRICVKAAKQFEELDEFYSACKTIGVGRNLIYPSVQTVSEELVETLEEFLNENSSSPMQMQATGKPFVLTVAGLSPKRHKSRSKEQVSDQTSELGSECKPREDLNVKTNTTPMVDLLSLDNCPANDEPNSSSADSHSGIGWELILPENVTPSSHTQLNIVKESGSGEGSELILSSIPTHHQTDISSNTFQTNTFHADISSNTFHASTTTALNQPRFPPVNHYNPFLEDMHDIPAVNSNPATAFEASFPANNPFAEGTRSRDVCNGMVNQENLIEQHRLWVQNQEKIIARHTMNV